MGQRAGRRPFKGEDRRIGVQEYNNGGCTGRERIDICHRRRDKRNHLVVGGQTKGHLKKNRRAVGQQEDEEPKKGINNSH